MMLRPFKIWAYIALVAILIVVVVMWVMAKFSSHDILARVKVPGSNLIVMLYEDEKGQYRYDVLADFKYVARGAMLGSHGQLAADPQIAVLGDHVTITYRTTENAAPFIEINLAECRIVQHSNPASPPPDIFNCKRK